MSRNKLDLNSDHVKIMMYLYAQGMSSRQVARETNYSYGYVSQLARRLGISRSKSDAAILAQPPKSCHWRSSRAAARKKMERHLKRKLLSIERVHHIDGDYTNNKIENLSVILAVAHGRLHRPANPAPRIDRPGRRDYMKKYLREYHKRKRAEKNAQTA